MRIYRVLRVRSVRGEMDVKALFDSGATFTVAKKSLAEKIGYIFPTDVREVTLADGKTRLRVLGCMPVFTSIEGSPIDDIAYIIEDLAEELIIGVKVMEFYEIKLDPSTNGITVGKNYSSFELYSSPKE